MKEITVIGAGLAGSECALFLAKNGVKVKLYDMKPKKLSPAHHNTNFCELVCSNTLKSNSLDFATGLLKEELRIMESEVLACAEKCSVPAGDALCVDRNLFSELVTQKLKNNENIEIIEEEVVNIDLNKPTIIATGPLTSDALMQELNKLVGDGLYFYDAIAPIVDAESVDMSKTFCADRWSENTQDHINCLLSKEEYTIFWQELINAQRAELKDFEKEKNFEGCLPVEVMAKRGFDVLRFGPMKPVGFNTKEKPFAVLQLRKENKEGTMLNLVGFQTNLTYPQQKKVFSLVPALKNANFLRYGAMHRNSYINAPKYLTSRFNMKQHPNIFFAGQISGVEGYVESIASGLLCAIYMFQYLNGKDNRLSINTALGALSNYLVSASEHNFQPMHINWGLMAPIDAPKNEKHKCMVIRAIKEIKEFKEKWNN